MLQIYEALTAVLILNGTILFGAMLATGIAYLSSPHDDIVEKIRRTGPLAIAAGLLLFVGTHCAREACLAAHHDRTRPVYEAALSDLRRTPRDPAVRMAFVRALREYRAEDPRIEQIVANELQANAPIGEVPK